MNVQSDKQIVTVAVITYHSAATVVETLDSIVSQTYGPENIELIISDDGSKDNTINIIKQWLVKHKCRFHSVKLFANPVNGGISKNCNVAWRAATSEWIKTIAGDDILFPDCLKDNIDFVHAHHDEKIAVVFSAMQCFEVDDNRLKINRAIMPPKEDIPFFNYSSNKQLKFLQRKGISGAPSAFINRVILSQVGFADENFRMIEDHPLWFKMTYSGFKLHFMNKITVFYRFGDSVSRSKKSLINEAFIKEIINIDETLIIPSLENIDFILILRKKSWTRLSLLVSNLFGNKVSFISRLLMLSVFIVRPGFLKYQLHKLKRKMYI
ncbi:glycosyltransferase family 2 protein [Aeromonas caviae]|uniref:glycosyltransferase family 2 protein n=1 Tax=Aeromonas caviae TaxID=648 RepID=UPI002B46C4AA|nr:glycosyltransferase [Aeromonas caviae]